MWILEPLWDWGLSQEQVSLGPASAPKQCVGSGRCVGRFPNKCPGDYEDAFIKVADSETKEGLSIEEATGENTNATALAL